MEKILGLCFVGASISFGCSEVFCWILKKQGVMRKVLKAVWLFCSYVFWPQRKPKDNEL